MPADVYENAGFGQHPGENTGDSICFSAYQRELNRLYMIASPVIEDIYGSHPRHSHNNVDEDADAGLAQTVTQQLWAWRAQLPPTLLLDFDTDCPVEISVQSKVHRLQSLALQLTFDNLLIILHRPFLSHQVDFLQDLRGVSSKAAPGNVQGRDRTPDPLSHLSTAGSSPDSQASSPLQWWHAAIRISKVTQLTRLAKLATDTHLVAFLAINLFNSAIVMVAHALPDPLSDKAQEAKRTITRIFRLQELLGKRSTLSMQSSSLLRSVIHLLLRREAEAILAPVRTDDDNDSYRTQSLPASRSVTGRTPSGLISGLSNDPSRATTESLGDGLPAQGSRLNEGLASVQKGTILTI